MNYGKIYGQLIEAARRRITTDYVERHHIVPKCMGGDNSDSNIVELTAREHYVAHLLLVKLYPNNKGVWYAANMMANRNSRMYEWVRKQHALRVSLDHTGVKHSEKAKVKMRESIALRRAIDEEGYCNEQRRRATNPKKKRDGYFKPKSAEHAQNISKAALTRIRVPCTICGKLVTTANIQNHQKVHK